MCSTLSSTDSRKSGSVSNVSQASQDDSASEDDEFVFVKAQIRVLPTLHETDEGTVSEEDYLKRFRERLTKKGVDVDKALDGVWHPQFIQKSWDPRLGPPQKQHVVMDRGFNMKRNRHRKKW
uniref:Uncharacterized protein n=1 Tax=Panagrolaimus sp. JU765 TaxID=591449 RepID=A0AC34Q7J1_9BILA